MLRLASHDTIGALEYLERKRATFATAEHGRPYLGRRWRVPAGSVALDYTLINDTLLIWTLDGVHVRLIRIAQSQTELTRITERVRIAMESHTTREADLQKDLAWLYDRLVRPVAARTGVTGTPLVLVADNGIPEDLFPALYDAQRGKYLIEDHALRFIPELNAAAAGVLAWSGATPRVVVAGDPAFAPAAYPGLERLPEARAEADSVAALYPGTLFLAGPAATRTALASAFLRVDVVHFAGHAVLNDQHADSSYLVLASERGSRAPGVLRAAELNASMVGHVRIVVLSACETLSVHNRRSEGLSGFAATLLGKGVGGVVGSSWKIEDRASRTLMIGFHRAYRKSGDAAAALQVSQLAMLRSHEPALRSPTAWAAFRYVGR
jgi:CHAT domain-containing protein